MDNKNGFVINDRDRILRAWQNSTELVRDYQNYANEMQKSNRELAVLLQNMQRMRQFMPQGCLNFFKASKVVHKSNGLTVKIPQPVVFYLLKIKSLLPYHNSNISEAFPFLLEKEFSG